MATEDATVEVEDDTVYEEVEPRILTNANPNFLMAAYYTVTSFLASHGWTVLVVGILLIIIWSNIEARVRKMLERRRESKDPIESNPEILAKRAEEMELARQRMQEKASEVLRREAERRKELEEQKKLEKLEDYDAMQAGRSSHAAQRKLNSAERAQNQTKPQSSGNSSRPQARPLRSDFNPLTGTSSGPRYRPSPRRTGGG